MALELSKPVLNDTSSSTMSQLLVIVSKGCTSLGPKMQIFESMDDILIYTTAVGLQRKHWQVNIKVNVLFLEFINKSSIVFFMNYFWNTWIFKCFLLQITRGFTNGLKLPSCYTNSSCQTEKDDGEFVFHGYRTSLWGD